MKYYWGVLAYLFVVCSLEGLVLCVSVLSQSQWIFSSSLPLDNTRPCGHGAWSLAAGHRTARWWYYCYCRQAKVPSHSRGRVASATAQVRLWLTLPCRVHDCRCHSPVCLSPCPCWDFLPRHSTTPVDSTIHVCPCRHSSQLSAQHD